MNDLLSSVDLAAINNSAQRKLDKELLKRSRQEIKRLRGEIRTLTEKNERLVAELLKRNKT